jgi:hypothetical protein
MRRWFETRLARLLAVGYVAARTRAIAALPHDELSRHATSQPVGGRPTSGPVRHRASQSSNAKRQRTVCAAPPEQSERNNA